jgi:hypothetical protein
MARAEVVGFWALPTYFELAMLCASRAILRALGFYRSPESLVCMARCSHYDMHE